MTKEEYACKKQGISHKLILKWVNMIDLMHIKGIHTQYFELLEKAGVDTMKELRHRVPENLYMKIKEINEKENLVRHLPSLTQVNDWIIQDQKLQSRVIY